MSEPTKYAFLATVEDHAKLDALIASAELLAGNAESTAKLIEELIDKAVTKLEDKFAPKAPEPEKSPADEEKPDTSANHEANNLQ